jgi:DNA-binding Lrp family transcriptional regulator
MLPSPTPMLPSRCHPRWPLAIADHPSIQAISPCEGPCALRYRGFSGQIFTVDYLPMEDVMVQAYILVQTEVGKAADVAKEIAKITGVTQAEDVTGPYDVIVRAEADNVDDLGRLVAAGIQSIEGITRTLTCPVVHF